MVGICLALLSLIHPGCSPDLSPDIQQATFLEATDDTGGPYLVTADIRPGDGETEATLFVTPDGPEAFVPSLCQGPPVPDLSRTSPDASPPTPDADLTDGGVPDADLPDMRVSEPDAAPPPSGLPVCYRVKMTRRGQRHEARLEGPPFLPGTRLFYFIEARDADGDVDRWPRSAPRGSATVLIGPPGRAPTLLAVTPSRGPVSGGTEVLIRGSGFSADTEILVGTEPPWETKVISPQLLQIVTPENPAGPADLVATRQGRRAVLRGAFTYEPPPALSSVVPEEGPTAGGTTILLSGEHLRPEDEIFVGGLPAVDVEWIDDTRVLATTPPQVAGVYAVQIVSADAQTATLGGAYTYWPPPQLEILQPEEGPDLGGTFLELLGRDLRAPGVVLVGEGAATEVMVTPDGRQAICVSPQGPAGVADVTFINPDGQFDILPMVWRYIGPPIIDPEQRLPVLARCGATELLLLGENFESGARFFFNGVEAEVIEIAEDGRSATLSVPPGEPGPVRVEVLNPDGRRARVDNLTEYGVRPVITLVDPREHPVWGGTLARVEGGDLEAGARVLVAGAPVESVRALASGCEAVLEIIVPPGPAGPADVLVVNPDGGEALRPEGVEYVAPSLAPDEGLTPGYTNVTLTGLDLRPGLEVLIGGRPPRALSRISDEEWRLVTPEGSRGPVEVSVFNADRRGVRQAGGFLYKAFDDDGDARFDPVGDCNDVLVADVNGDARLDLVVANGSVGQVGTIEQSPAVHYGDGRVGFYTERLQPVGNGMNVSLGDVDADGDLDLLVANLSSASNTFFRNEGGRFSNDRTVPIGGPSYDGALIDIDGDADVDMFLLNTGDPENGNIDGPETLRLNDGRGGFGEQVSDRVYFSRGDVHDHDVELGDVDNDGLPDAVIVVDNMSEGFRTAENRLLITSAEPPGTMAFSPSPFNGLLGDWLHAELADLNLDGNLDLLLPQDYIEGLSFPDQPALGLFLGDGRGGFEPAHERNRGLPLIPAFETVTTDLDGDGDPDILVAGYGLLSVDGQIAPERSFILLNDGTTNFFDGSAAFVNQREVGTADFGVLDVDGDGDLDIFECAARRRSRVWIRD